MKINSYEKNGWISFPYSFALNKWAKKVEEIVSSQIFTIPEGDKDLRCGGTWFPGVNFLNNKRNGDVDGVFFPEELKSFIVENEPAFDAVFDKAQISICYTGYHKKMKAESSKAFKFRTDRFSAHIDGILPLGQGRRRFLKEYHSFILGIPINSTSNKASPCVIWEGSHAIVRDAFKKYKEIQNIDTWDTHDITDFYNKLRSEIFNQCIAKTIWVPVGHAYLIHRLSFHGILPWKDNTKRKSGRMIAYFRPDLFQGQINWLK